MKAIALVGLESTFKKAFVVRGAIPQRLFISALLVGLSCGGAEAASETWAGASGTQAWANTANWSNAIIPGADGTTTNGDTGTFNTSAASTVTIDSTRNVKSLLFDGGAGAFTIGSLGANGGSALVLTSGGAITLGSTATSFTGTGITETINAPLTLEGSYSFTNNSTTASDVLGFAGNISNAATTTITVSGANTGANTISGAISNGTGVISLTKSGAGNWILSGANTYTGATTISAGTLQVANSSALQDSIVTISAANGLTFASGLGTATVGGLSGASNESLTDLSSGAIALTVGNNNSTGMIYSGALSGTGASLTKTGTGIQTLSGANSYTGGTTISAGTLEFTVPGSMPATGAVAVSNGATLAIAAGGAGQFSNATSGNGSIGGIFANTGGQGAGVTLNSGATVGIDTAGGSVSYGGNITNAGVSLNKLGANTLILAGANSYTGSTTITAGTLSVTGSLGSSGSYAGAIADAGAFSYGGSASQTLSGNITGAGSLTQAGAGTLILSGADTYTGGTTVSASDEIQLGGSGSLNSTGNLAANGTFDLNGLNATVGQLSGSGTITNSGGGSAATGTLTVGTSGATYPGTIVDGAGKTAVVYDLTNQSILSGSSSYSGGTTLNGSGSIRSNSTSSTLGTGPVTMNGTTGLLYTSGNNIAPSFVINGTFNFIDGNFTNGQGEFAGSFTGAGYLDWLGNSGGANAGFNLNGSLSGYTGTMDVEFGGNNNSQNKTERIILNTASANSAGTAWILGANAPGTANGNDILSYVGTASTNANVTLGSLAGNPQGILRNDTAGSTTSTATFTIGGLSTNPIYTGQITDSGLGNKGITAINIAEASGFSQTLGGVGTYTGGTTVSSGVLNLTGGLAQTVLTGATITNASESVTVSGTAGLQIGQVVSGPGIPTGDTIDGITSSTVITLITQATASSTTGTITFAAASSIGSGPVVVNSTGTLNVGSATALQYASSPSITVNSGGALTSSVGSAGNATINPSIIINGGGSLGFTANTLGTLTIGNLTSGGGTASSWTFNIGSGGSGLGNAGTTYDTIADTNLTINGGTTNINIDASGGSIATGTYVLVSIGGTMTGTVGADLHLNTTSLDGDTLSLGAGTGAFLGDIVLTVNPAPASSPVAYFNGLGSDLATTSNFYTTANGNTVISTAPSSSTDMYLTSSSSSTTGGSVLTPTLNSALTINSLNFTGTGTPATAGVNLTGSGTLTLMAATTTGSGGTNTAPNGITVATGAGNDTIGVAVALGASQTWTVTDATNKLTVSGQVSDGGHSYALTKAGSGVLALSGSNTYSGGTTVSAGTLLASNTTAGGSATGTGSLTVSAGATLGGYGTSSGTSFSISGTGTGTGLRANVMAGLNSATDTSVATKLALIGSAASTIQNANLTFNLNSAVAGGLGTDPTNSGTELSVGNTAITFVSGMQSTILTLNLVGTNIIAANTPYVLVAGTTGGTDQYTGLALGTSTGSLAAGLITPILNSGNGGSGDLTIALSSGAAAYYGSNSYLFLYQNSTTGADDIEVEVVPEPSTWALMIGGVAMLVLWQRRKRNLNE